MRFVAIFHMKMTGILRFLIILMSCLILAACSRVKFAYHQLDWLIPHYVDNYIDLSHDQGSYLDAEVENLLAWHCSSHLNEYADLLRRTNRGIQHGSIDTQVLHLTLSEVEGYWKEIKQQASPAIARLFLTADSGQLEEFFSGLEERNSEWLADYQAKTHEVLAKDYRERMTEQLERWFGPLTLTQQQAVYDWSQRFEPLGREWLQVRRDWQASLQAVLSERAENEAYFDAIEALFVNPYAGQPMRYLNKLEQNKRLIIELLVQLGSQLTAQQKQHLHRMVASVAGDLEQLACSSEISKPQAAKDEHPADILLGPF